ncbi:MAG: hypothetical protein JO209_10470 [Acidisphaera sp.]|nr:hypothetical protein [Acidisphaera sp.]
MLAFLGFVLGSLWSPAGFIGFFCGLSRSIVALLVGALVATVVQALLVLAISAESLDPLFVVTTPLAALIAGGIGWGVARLFFGPKREVSAEPYSYLETADLGRPTAAEREFEEGHQPG